jgi:hypothetical protein
MAINNPILENPSRGHALYGGIFWFIGIPMLEKSVLNLSIMVCETWKVTALEAQ